MSRNMRAIRIVWGEHAGVFVLSDDFEKVADAIIADAFDWNCEWSDPDEAFRFRASDGHAFLNRVRDCNPREIAKKLDRVIRDDAVRCVENMQALEPEWRSFVEKDGSLEIWVDGY